MITALESAGVDTISIDAGQAIQLAGAGYDFDVGTDAGQRHVVPEPRQHEQHHGAAAALFGDADVTVALTQSDVQSLVAGTDVDFDNVITALESAGVDTISIDAGQAVQLAGAGFDFDVGTDVLVNGTSFLNHGSTTSITAAAALFGDADVTVALTQSDVQSLVAAGPDATFDDVMSALINANVDTISIDAGQVGQLAVAGFDFNEGVDVTVQGTAFLGGGNPVSIDAAHAVLGNAHVTVALQQSDVQQLVAHGGAAFDNVVAALQDAGADQISIDAGQALQFADAGFTFDADSSVVVHGTAFLSTGDDGGVDHAVKALFGGGDERRLAMFTWICVFRRRECITWRRTLAPWQTCWHGRRTPVSMRCPRAARLT